jgi:hypothetical protein
MGTNRSDYCYGQSQYMRADDWLGKSVRTLIEAVEDVEFEQGLKPVLKLRGQDKKLVVNATNFDILADALGNNPTKWSGHVILLEGIKVAFKGKRVPSIRVSVPAPLKSDDPDDDLPEDMVA